MVMMKIRLNPLGYPPFDGGRHTDAVDEALALYAFSTGQGLLSEDVMRLLTMTSKYELHDALVHAELPLPRLPEHRLKEITSDAACLLAGQNPTTSTNTCSTPL
jgi:hypothetical protein